VFLFWGHTFLDPQHMKAFEYYVARWLRESARIKGLEADSVEIGLGLKARLIDAQVGGCSCLTKTPDFRYHEGTCHYRLHEEARQEIERLEKWVSDLQSGMYVNCVYCGHQYGPGETTPATMADALKAHIERCPEHPMSALRRAVQKAVNIYRAHPQTNPGECLQKMATLLIGALGEEP
jgi:hypothetical protein